MNLTLEERTKIFDKICRLVETKHFNPSMNGVDWNTLAKNRRERILASAEPEAFEKAHTRLAADTLLASRLPFTGPGKDACWRTMASRRTFLLNSREKH
jgi:Tricorn protease C1 domain